MQARTNIIEESFERVQDRFRSAGDELQKLQDRAAKNRRDFTKRTQKRSQKVQKRLLKVPAIKAADEFRVEVFKQIESNVDEFLSLLPVASNADIKKLERKVNALTKKIRTLEKAQSN
jgi:hypothetical protein